MARAPDVHICEVAPRDGLQNLDIFVPTEAKCALIGGHTIRNPEPVYGLAVTGLVSPRRMITNAAARVGDLLVLTKPLGTGIATTGIKRGLTSRSLARKAITLMRQLNTVGAELGERGFVQGRSVEMFLLVFRAEISGEITTLALQQCRQAEPFLFDQLSSVHGLFVAHLRIEGKP